MTWFGKLRKTIEDEQDYALFDETIKCYRTGAYRMAYIGTWIAIAESLKNKFKLMAERDNVADQIVKKIEELESKHSPPDRFILNEAKKINIIDDVAFEKIEHIFTMRNLFAHPYNIAPTAKETRNAITTAIDKVLSVPPLLRKPYINDLLNNLQKNRHYIDDSEEKVTKFATDVTNRISPHLYPYLLKALFYRLNETINDCDKNIFVTRLVWFSQTFISHVKPDFSENVWDLRRKFDDFQKAVSIILVSVDIWDLIPENIQDSIISYLLFPENGFEPWTLRSAFILFKNKKLTHSQEEHLKKRFRELKAIDMAGAEIPLEYYADKIIDPLSSHNWYSQNPAAKLLWNIGPNAMEGVSENILEELGRNILQSAEGDAGESVEFLRNMLTSSSIKWPESFIRGLLYECFLDDNNEFRYKCTHIYKAILIAIRCSKGNSIDLFNTLIADIDKSEFKYAKPTSEDTRKAVEELKKVIGELQDKEKTFEEKLNCLIKKIRE